MVSKPVITTEHFSTGQDVPECPHCRENLVNLASDNFACVDCEQKFGNYCGLDGCKGKSYVVTKDATMCKSHAVEYLYDMYDEVFQLVQKLEEEKEYIEDKQTELDSTNKEDCTSVQTYINTEIDIESRETWYATQNESLRQKVEEVESLQKALDIHVIDL